MKDLIKAIDIYMLDGGNPGWRPVVCRIETEDGLYGYGEVSLGFDKAANGAVGMLKELAPMVIGMDALEHEAVWNHLMYDSFWGQGGGAVVYGAISAIDTALWDIKGKRLGLPIWKLLGGKLQPKLRAYASQLQFGWDKSGMQFDKGFRTEDLAESSRKAIAEGYSAIKINFITYREDGKRWGFLRGPLSLEAKRVIDQRISAVRDAVGPDIDILVENHGRTDLASALDLAELIKPYDVLLMEEPSTPMNIDVCKNLKAQSRIPIAGGERIYGRWSFLNHFQAGTLDIVQPDIGTCGGITETKKICDMAHCYDVSVQTHVCGSPIAIAASLQVEATLPHFYIHEHHLLNITDNNISLGLYNYQPENGYCSIPDLPGLGQELSEKAIRTALIHERITETV